MFYITAYNDRLNFYEEEVPNSVAIEDDFENRFLYSYNKKLNKIERNTGISYVVEEKDGEAIVIFDTSQDLYINARFVHDNYLSTEYGCIYVDEGLAELRFNIAVTGTLTIESATESITFIPIHIETENLIDDDIQPTLKIEGNTIHVQPHPYYVAIAELKKEIQLLKGE